MPDFTSWAPTSSFWSAVLDPSTAVAVASRRVFLTVGPSAEGRMPAAQALSIWASCFQASSSSLTPWPAWTPLATALIEGRWAGGVTTLGIGRCLPPVSPGKRQLQAFQRQPQQHVPAAPGPTQASQRFSVMSARIGSVQGFSAAHAINALRVGIDIANQAKFKKVANSALQLWFPEEWERVLAGRLRIGHRTPQPHGP